MVVGDKTTVVDSTVAKVSTSDRLIKYPKGQLSSPLDEREATATVKPGGPAYGGDRKSSPVPLPSADRLNDLISERTLTIPFAIFALAVSFILGGFHAVAPGHGKTVMAAYLVGQRGARRQALLLGATVAVTHTGGVLALALVVSNSAIAPDRFYPILGSISGLLVVIIGVVLLKRAVEFRRIFPTLGPGASRHHHHGIGGHTHTHDDLSVGAHSAEGAHDHDHGDAGHHLDGRIDRGQEPVATSVLTTSRHADHDHPGHDHAGHDHGDGGHQHDHPLDQGGHTHDQGSDGDGHDHVGHAHDHDADHGHAHDPVSSQDDGHLVVLDPALEPVPPVGPAMQARSMMAMGFAGGLVPSPSALVVLLGAIAIGRAWFGLLLIVAYGAGLAAVLVGAGLIIERLRHRIEPLLARRSGSRMAGWAVNLPIVTAVLVVLGGAYLIVRALAFA